MTLFELPETATRTAAGPYELFHQWLGEAKGSEPNDPDAACLATALDGRPSARMVLVRQVDARGCVFFTNAESRKGRQLLGHGFAALCWHWKTLGRQVRMEGRVAPVSAAESDAYFNARPRGSRIGAWASAQSQALDSRETLIARVAEIEALYAGRDDIPRPPHWHGFRLEPDLIEFWQEGLYRLHDRFVLTPDGGGAWRAQRLYP